MDPSQVVRDENGMMRCRECGFTYGRSREEVVELTGQGLEAVRTALAGADSTSRHLRPDPLVWSVNAYVAHLADAAELINGRVHQIAEQEDPTLAWHDQDAAVEEGRQDAQPADESQSRLENTVARFLSYLTDLPPKAWKRSGVHSRAGAVRLAEVAQDMPHELQHHANDIQKVDRQVRSDVQYG